MNQIRTLLVLCILMALAAPALAQDSSDTAPLAPDNSVGQRFVLPAWSFESNNAYIPPNYAYHRMIVTASGCDVNNDGYEDVLVGKRDYDNPSYVDSGRAWLFLGSANGLPLTPSRSFDPPYLNTYGFFGASLACNGDVNGDGYDDVLIGGDNYDNTSPDEGSVWLWRGNALGVETNFSWMARGNATYAHFGVTLDYAGDVNGDGYDDIIVGAYRSDYNYVSHAYVWLGSSSGLGTNGLPSNADWVASAPSNAQGSGILFGEVVRGIGDVNNDGADEVMVSARGYDGGITDQGAVFVYYGSKPGGLGPAGTTSNYDWMATSGQADSRFGWGGDGVGDLNNDGFDDVAVGAYYYDNGESNEGMLWVWYGSAGGLGSNGTPANAGWSAQPNQASAVLGFVVRPAGDVNGDGISDLFATSYGYDIPIGAETILDAGAWFIWFGSLTGPGDPGTPANADLYSYGDQPSQHLGRDDAAAGDVNHDSLDEPFVGATLYTNVENTEGRVVGYDDKYRLYLPLVNRITP